MKNIFFFILLSIFTATLGTAQQKTSIASYALHAHVKALREKSTNIAHGDTTLVVDDEVFFNRAGKVDRIVHHHPFNLLSEDYQYDNNGRLQQIIQYSTNNKIYLTKTYNYVSNDSTYTITSTTSGGHVFERESYEQGKELSFERYGPDTSKSDWTSFSYDRFGRLISEVVFYHKKPSYQNIYNYAGSGKDNTDTFYDKDDKISFAEQRYYNKQGMIIHTLAHLPGGKFLVERFTTYDAHGNEINKREVDNIMNLSWDMQYLYDNHGNWTKRHTQATTGKHYETTVTREIYYY
jgi:hypothetical protein